MLLLATYHHREAVAVTIITVDTRRTEILDFFYFELIDFPIFNVADIYVTCATIVLALLILFYYKEEELDCLFPKKKEK